MPHGCTYPIDLIQVIGLEDQGADHTLTFGGLHGDRNLTKENVEVGLDGGSITTLGEGELGAIGTGVDGTSSGGPLVEGTGLGEVKAQLRRSATRIRRASLLEGIAASVCLGGRQGSSDGESRGSELDERRHVQKDAMYQGCKVTRVWEKINKHGGQEPL